VKSALNRNVRLIFFAHPRSGSSSLYQILQLHPELNILEEPFNENFTRWNRNNKNYREQIHDLPSLETTLTEIFSVYNGIKMLDYQLPDPLAVHLLQRPDFKVIFLRRKNLLKSVVSVLIAEQTHLWKKWEMTRPMEEYYSNLQPLDLQDITQRVADLKNHLDFFEAVLDAQSKAELIKFTYEELYFSGASRQRQQIAAIWNLLGIAALALEQYQVYLKPEAMQINSAATYAFLPNAREIHEACGNEVTGWLF
jgi:hypothetical protein